jgi:hypothetical protein
MKSPFDPTIKRLCFSAVMILLAAAAMELHTQTVEAAPSQQASSSGGFGIIDDWTTHHVVFSDPGTFMDAVMNGRRQQWEQIVNDPRYRMQQVRRSVATANVMGTPEKSSDSESQPVFGRLGDNRFRRNENSQSLAGKWNIAIAAGGGGPALDMYPAKYTFSPIGAPACTDFVAFPNQLAGANNSSPNIVGLTNLYNPLCTTTTPTFLFSYFVGTGTVQTSPVLSLTGTKVAFVESISGGSRFHVVTIGTSGTNASTSGFAPKAPCTVNGATNSVCTSGGYTNNAVDNYIVMNGGVMVTRSSPFVDYAHDTAYVGDDTGKLHKFTPVFNGTPAEVTTGGWPFSVTTVILSPPTYDAISGNIFMGGNLGNLWCVSSATPARCSTGSITLGSGSSPAILDAPTVDSTQGTVFAVANTSSNATLSQVTTSMKNPSTGTAGSAITVNVGVNGTDLFDGTFDNAYYTSVATGHRYVCGNLTTAATPTLWRVTFNSSGAMTGTDSSFTPLQVVLAGDTGTGYDCSPLTEVNNASLGHDILFFGVKNGGNFSGCSTTTCVISYDLGSSLVLAAVTSPSIAGSSGVSGIIIDNVVTTNGGSQIYFGAPSSANAVQLSQSGLN